MQLHISSHFIVTSLSIRVSFITLTNQQPHIVTQEYWNKNIRCFGVERQGVDVSYSSPVLAEDWNIPSQSTTGVVDQTGDKLEDVQRMKLCR